MPSVDPRLRSRTWRALRMYVLERDGFRCQIERAGCDHMATEVDHIVPPVEGGPFWEPTNLRAACKPCNSRRGSELRNRRRTRFGYNTTAPTIETRL